MDDDQQPAAAPATRGRRASRVPGDTGGDQQPAAAQHEDEAAVEEDAGRRFTAVPDFRHKSAAAAAKWFKENPDANKRGVLTAEGYYVHPDAFKTEAEK
jgi:hypothetical protein